MQGFGECKQCTYTTDSVPGVVRKSWLFTRCSYEAVAVQRRVLGSQAVDNNNP